VLILRREFLPPRAPRLARMHRIMVKITNANIFKGISQTQKSRENTQNFAKIQQKATCGSAVYHPHINHD
jgi:hypothetical protein